MPLFRQLLTQLGVDRAVSYAMAARVWQIPSGAITTLLIALCFRPEQQGVYYLILTLTGLQALADAGLINTLLHAASHEAVGTRFDSHGFLRANRRQRRRLAGLFRFALVWFSVAACLLVVIGGIAAVVLLGRQQVLAESAAPTAVAIVLAGLALTVSPLVAILEGCGQVQTVNRYRLAQAVSGSIVVWAFLVAGGGLWTAAAAIAAQLFWEWGVVFGRFGRFFAQLWRLPAGEFDWRNEVWPLQWRIGVQSVARYMAFFPILPVLFDSQGPELAGRYGMTWQVLSNLMMVAYAYVRTRSPDFGRLIAERRRAESSTMFKRVTAGSTLLLVLLLGAFCAALVLLGQIPGKVPAQIASRFLDPSTCLWFAFAVVAMHLTQCFAMFIRSQKFDPIWRVNLPGCLTLGILVYLAASAGKLEWIAASMMLTFGLSALALALMYRWYNRHFWKIESEGESADAAKPSG